MPPNEGEQTYFAPAQRASESELLVEIDAISRNPIVEGLLNASAGLLAVLNEHRQILAVNTALLRALGTENAADVIGLRPGEAVNCAHAHDMPGGCGTGEVCASCGAAIAIVTALAGSGPVHRTCAIATEKHGVKSDLYLDVQALAMSYGGRPFLLLFLHDITRQQQAEALERAFFHDIANVISSLTSASEALARRAGGGARTLSEQVSALVQRLGMELKLQRCLTDPRKHVYQLAVDELPIGDILTSLRDAFAGHPSARGKRVRIDETQPGAKLQTDVTLLLRVLGNMLVNALEASGEGDEVRISAGAKGDSAIFEVWNRQRIAPEVMGRIFQRNFSTKESLGRGLGTYSMKLFGEQYLGGRVSFTSSASEGTTFRLELPLRRKIEEC